MTDPIQQMKTQEKLRNAVAKARGRGGFSASTVGILESVAGGTLRIKAADGRLFSMPCDVSQSAELQRHVGLPVRISVASTAFTNSVLGMGQALLNKSLAPGLASAPSAAIGLNTLQEDASLIGFDQ